MGVLNEALEFLGIAGGSNRYGRQGSGTARQEQQELAATMRALPGRFADRLSACARERVTGAAAAGRWEEAVDELVAALHARVEVVTAAEREELRTVLVAMNMDGDRVDGLPRRQ